MSDYSVLIGGKAGFGIDKSGFIIGRILNQLNYCTYIYRDYPSLIRGGHTFSIIRAADERIATHRNEIDFILALNQDTVNFHKNRSKKSTVVIFDSDSVKAEGVGVPIGKILKEENASEIMRNTCIIGAFAKAGGIEWKVLEEIIRKEIPRETEDNLKVAKRGFDAAQELIKIQPLSRQRLPLLSGSQAVGLGLAKAGLDNYIAYPMTPSSPLLHFLAENSDKFGVRVIHPESEIAVVLMALGFSYMGKKSAVGTSGGGFCLMTEGLSLSAMAELPVVIMLGQRPGPSTGLPTYSSQTELLFALSAGQGEFVRLIVAPGDPEEAYYYSALALNLSWKYQIPSFILTDKDLAEGVFNIDINSVKEIQEQEPVLWDRKSSYKRYQFSESGVSPLAFVPEKDNVIKVNSYEHDEAGITTEDSGLTKSMQEKRLRKGFFLAKELEDYEVVKTYGNKDASTGILCWGSTKGVCVEAANNLGLKVVQPVALNPFPVAQFQLAIKGLKNLICVENNATAQLAKLIKLYGFGVSEKILKYDGRPFSLDELMQELKAVLK